MKLLLDTHLLLWWLADDKALTLTSRALIEDLGNEVFVSSATAWEIEIKRALGKLRFDGHLAAAIDTEGFSQLDITFAHTADVGVLPAIHQDPFDRILVAQARIEQMQLLTVDRMILRYPVNAVDCSN